MSGVGKSTSIPHEKFINELKVNKANDPAPEKQITISGKEEIIKKLDDNFIGASDTPGGRPKPNNDIKKIQHNISEITGKLFPTDPIKLVKTTLNETDPKKQLSMLMNFQKELDGMSSDQLHEIKGFLLSKKEDGANSPILKKLSLEKSDIVDSLLDSVNNEINSRGMVNPHSLYDIRED